MAVGQPLPGKKIQAVASYLLNEAHSYPPAGSLEKDSAVSRRVV